jgi:hypothetical protein
VQYVEGYLLPADTVKTGERLCVDLFYDLEGRVSPCRVVCLYFPAEILHFPLKETDLLAQFFSQDNVRQNQVRTDLWHEDPDDQDKEKGDNVKFGGSSEVDHQNHSESQGQDGDDLNQFPPVEGFQGELFFRQLFMHRRALSLEPEEFAGTICYDG